MWRVITPLMTTTVQTLHSVRGKILSQLEPTSGEQKILMIEQFSGHLSKLRSPHWSRVAKS